MTSAKSLKKLRSATIAFLEDGGSLLHGVDGLVRDISRTIVDLERREREAEERESALLLCRIQLEEREAIVAQLETKLIGLLNSVQEKAVSVSCDVSTTNSVVEPLDMPLAANPDPIKLESPIESVVHSQVDNLSKEVAEAVVSTESVRPLPSMLHTTGHRRKKRRR